MKTQIQLGDKIECQLTNSCGATVTYRCTVRKLEIVKGFECAWVEFPAQVLRLPFPPNGGKRYMLAKISDLLPNLVKIG